MPSLDLSAAFDTVPHGLLLSRLEKSFGIHDTTLAWLSSYLSERFQYVSVNNQRSLTLPLSTGVPQGSVLGPLLFSVFTSPIHNVISSFGLSHQQYADDTLIFCPVSMPHYHPSVANMEQCLATLCTWFASNGLSINPSKSEAIIFSTRQRLAKLKSLGLVTVAVFDSIISLSSSLSILGVTLDSTLSFGEHCGKTVRSCLFSLRALRHVRPLLSDKDAQLIATSLVQSRLDYCNSLLSHTASLNLKRLQRIQHALARLVSPAQKGLSHRHLLASLHWLPIPTRITYKLASVTHTAITCKQPKYLSDLLTPYTPCRSLRSSDASLLKIPRTHLGLSSQSYSLSAASIWNGLPLDIRADPSHTHFCKQLKTHLFTLVTSV